MKETVETTEPREKTDRDFTKIFDTLESSVDDMNKSSRLRGFAEGCLVTLGGVAVTGLIALTIIKRKR